MPARRSELPPELKPNQSKCAAAEPFALLTGGTAQKLPTEEKKSGCSVEKMAA
jgi:hypothetical protein